LQRRRFAVIVSRTMTDLELVIGSKNRSSWSLRPWLLMTAAGVPFRETRIPYHLGDWHEQVRALSPNGRVPALRRGPLALSESLAIAEYVAELFPDRRLWPENREVRAVARSFAAEMHAGFAALRRDLTMDVTARIALGPLPDETRAELARVEEIWALCFTLSRGPFLLGSFGIIDAMFAPLVLRFATYGVAPGPAGARFADAVLALPAMQRWIADAAREVAEEPAVLGPGQVA
jgi:glutathione S-transferase